MLPNLICRLEVTVGTFKFNINNPWYWAGALFVLLVLWRWWGIKKLLSFSIIISLLIFLMFRFDTIITEHLGKEEGSPFAMLTRPFFIALCGFVFLYYGFLRKDS